MSQKQSKRMRQLEDNICNVSDQANRVEHALANQTRCVGNVTIEMDKLLRRMKRLEVKAERRTAQWCLLLMFALTVCLLIFAFAAPRTQASEPVPTPAAVIAEPPALTVALEPEPVSLGTFKAYAYCSCSKCCGKWSQYNKTASGTTPEEGRTVAADWDVIAPGTEIYIDGAGPYIVEDKGSGISGNTLDVYHADHQAALEWGVREVEVTLK